MQNLGKSVKIGQTVTIMAIRSSHKIVNGTFPLTQLEAACLAGVESATLINWGRQENPPPRNTDGSYDARQFGEWMRKHQTRKRGPGRFDNYPFAPDPVPKMPEPGLGIGPATDKNTVEIRLKTAQAEKVEMENKVTAGQLIPVDEIEPALGDMITRVKSRLLKLPVALSPLVLGDDDLYSIQQKLRDGVNDALSEVSVDWKAGVVGDDEQAS